MNYQFTIQFTEEHIKYAARKFFFKRFGKTFFPIGAFLFALICLTYLQAGKIDALVGICLGIFLCICFSLVSLYARAGEKKLALFRNYGGKVSYDLSDDSFKSKTGWTSAEIKWERFQAIWIFPKLWLLLSRDGAYFTFPSDQISNEIKEFLKQKIVSVGGEIK